MNRRHSGTVIFFLAAALMLQSAPAAAYLDPGSGSALLQGVLAALAAIALTLKLYWHRLLRLLGLKKKPRSEFDVDAYMAEDDTGNNADKAKDSQ